MKSGPKLCFRLVIMAVGSIWPGIALAQPTCPLTAPETALAVRDAPPGWKARITGTMRLTSAGMLHGPFDGSGYLKPYAIEERKTPGGNKLTSTWEFGPPPHYEKWLVCEYGNALELYKRIGDEVTSCKMTTVASAGIISNISFACIGSSKAVPAKR